ncbi:hypothetical protein AGMMS49531_09860 [Endomicrobiia bacterium]|nr:hypothetical protein AGMMS49531_09860 [Endomicrobiia bacterium]
MLGCVERETGHLMDPRGDIAVCTGKQSKPRKRELRDIPVE